MAPPPVCCSDCASAHEAAWRNVIELSIPQARQLHLAAQGLLSAPSRRATPAALRTCIERMGLLQIDTIHVVARSPYLVLFSRLGAYPMQWLEQALARGEVFESWAHEACFVPIGDLALHRSYNRSTRQHWGLARARAHNSSQRAKLDQLLQHVQTHGPVKSSDFARSDGRRGGGWWGWKDEKLWLEALFANGELMVARRENFHRVYDLAHRVCPQIEGMVLPDSADIEGAFVEKSVAALGITQARWINDYYRTKPRLKDADLEPWVEQGSLLRVAVAGWDAPAYVHRSRRNLLGKVRRGEIRASRTTVLSPFDPLVWDRERVLAMFGFDYRIECYTPQERRRYGYFVLPVLHQDRLVARLDAKAHRALGEFEVRSLHLEPGVVPDEPLLQALAQALLQCAAWHGTPVLKVLPTSPRGIGVALRRALRACG